MCGMGPPRSIVLSLLAPTDRGAYIEAMAVGWDSWGVLSGKARLGGFAQLKQLG
jgi:hypothetical protein